MTYFKFFGDALSHAFAEAGLKDDNGNPIQPTGQPMTAEEYAEMKRKEMEEKVNRFTTKQNSYESE